MTAFAPRDAVYALARTQLDWIPAGRPGFASPEGFAHGRDERGRQLRWLTCPDCLTNDGEHRFDCETCGGRGELPDTGRDPYESSAWTLFGGVERERAVERRRLVDGQLIRLAQQERIRAGTDDVEDWLTRAVRLKEQLHARGDYPLLEQAQETLAIRFPLRHLAWTTFVVEGQPLSLRYDARHRLDETADWLADRILAAIARQVADEVAAGEALGVRRIRTRPESIVVPAEHLAAAAPGKGRWANGAAQGNRDATVAGLAAEGKTAGQIARQVGLSKRRVQQLLAGMDLAAVASGPAA